MTREYYNRRRAKDAILTYVSKYGYTDIAVFVAQDGAIYIVIPDINDTDDIKCGLKICHKNLI